jgi:dCTP diphosphatase
VIDNQKLATLLRSFAAERDWDQFHTPKNLATSISVEAGELLELFQWSRGQKDWNEVSDGAIQGRVEDELADILLYVIRFADKAGMDLQAIAERKIASNKSERVVQSGPFYSFPNFPSSTLMRGRDSLSL